MKILYAAGNTASSKTQLSRFLRAMASSNHQIKIAAYRASSPQNTSVSWTLDALSHMYQPEYISTSNDNLEIYYDQVKSFAPDLIISDLEYYTSYIATTLDIPLWQCSASLTNFALTYNEKYDLGLSTLYSHILNRNPLHRQRTLNIIDNSNCNYIYSHFGDMNNPPQIQSNYEWIRPYHQICETYKPCRHNIVAAISNNKHILCSINIYKDSIAFIDDCRETYDNITIKNMSNDDEYYCNLYNANSFVCHGQTSFLADAFYNGHFSFIWPDYQDIDSIVNSRISQKLHLGKIVSDPIDFTCDKVVPHYNDGTKYLHEKILEIT